MIEKYQWTALYLFYTLPNRTRVASRRLILPSRRDAASPREYRSYYSVHWILCSIGCESPWGRISCTQSGPQVFWMCRDRAVLMLLYYPTVCVAKLGLHGVNIIEEASGKRIMIIFRNDLP